MIVLCIILFVIAVELGVGLYLYAEANSPPKTSVFDGEAAWFEDLPNRLKVTRKKHENRTTGVGTIAKKPKANLGKLTNGATLFKNGAKGKVVAGKHRYSTIGVPGVGRRTRTVDNRNMEQGLTGKGPGQPGY